MPGDDRLIEAWLRRRCVTRLNRVYSGRSPRRSGSLAGRWAGPSAGRSVAVSGLQAIDRTGCASPCRGAVRGGDQTAVTSHWPRDTCNTARRASATRDSTPLQHCRSTGPWTRRPPPAGGAGLAGGGLWPSPISAAAAWPWHTGCLVSRELTDGSRPARVHPRRRAPISPPRAEGCS